MTVVSAAVVPRLNPAPLALQAAPQAEKPPELEYAKKYVSTIRTRFENSPKMYQEFLNILQVLIAACCMLHHNHTHWH